MAARPVAGAAAAAAGGAGAPLFAKRGVDSADVMVAAVVVAVAAVMLDKNVGSLPVKSCFGCTAAFTQTTTMELPQRQ